MGRWMARYYLDLIDGGVHRDDVGQELGDHAAVRNAATARLAAYLAEKPPPLLESGAMKIRVRDEAGSVVLVLTLDMD